MEQNNFKNKTIRCFLCKEYDDKTSICNIRKVKLKAKSKRRCEHFVPDHEKIDHEINKGSNIKKHKRPEWYFLRGSERKKYIVKEEMERMLKENQRDDAHPLTGTLGNISSTAGAD